NALSQSDSTDSIQITRWEAAEGERFFISENTGRGMESGILVSFDLLETQLAIRAAPLAMKPSPPRLLVSRCPSFYPKLRWLELAVISLLLMSWAQSSA